MLEEVIRGSAFSGLFLALLIFVFCSFFPKKSRGKGSGYPEWVGGTTREFFRVTQFIEIKYYDIIDFFALEIRWA